MVKYIGLMAIVLSAVIMMVAMSANAHENELMVVCMVLGVGGVITHIILNKKED